MEAAVLFQPIRGHRLSAQIAEQLQLAIFSGAIVEGERLPPERELVERFGASRASVQEAVHQLELQGLVTIRRGSNGGAFVTKPDFAKVTTMLQTMIRANRFDVAALYQARLLIEPGVAEIAARVAGAENVAALRGAIASSKLRFDRGERTHPVSHHFHYLLARAAGSDLLVMLVSSLLSVREAQRILRRPSSDRIRICAHEAIVYAIERGDAEAAKRATTDHLMQLLDEIVTGSEAER
jgi:GntR family transcriptional regulator, transcriptional repressor for pyruvate dehydrogenase complex